MQLRAPMSFAQAPMRIRKRRLRRPCGVLVPAATLG